jgi:hypothetical protein
VKVKTDPVQEAIAKKLLGVNAVPAAEQAKMIKRAAKAGAEAIRIQANIPREPRGHLAMSRRVGLLIAQFPDVLAYHAKMGTPLPVMQSWVDWNAVLEKELLGGLTSEIRTRLSGPDRYRYADLSAAREEGGYLGKELGIVLMSVSTAERLLKGE